MREFSQMFYLKVIFSSGVEFSVNITYFLEHFLEHVRDHTRSLEGQQNTIHSEKGSLWECEKSGERKKICEEEKVLTHTEHTLVVRLFELL